MRSGKIPQVQSNAAQYVDLVGAGMPRIGGHYVKAQAMIDKGKAMIEKATAMNHELMPCGSPGVGVVFIPHVKSWRRTLPRAHEDETQVDR